MNRKWLAALIVMLGVPWDALAELPPAPVAPFQFVAMGTNDIKYFNTNLYSYAGVATSGTNYFLVGANSLASFAAIHAPVAGGYLTNYSAWTAKNVTNGYNLNAVTYGAGLFVAGGSDDAIFTNSGGAWSGPLSGGSGNSVSIEGLAFGGGTSNTFVSVTASYLATWASADPANWTPGNDLTPAIVESFRSVTAMGANRFALAGLGGDVRVSPDGGHTWNQTKEFDFLQPILTAIASDGSNTLVVAGPGIVEVSTNAGGSWVTNAITGFTNTTFYGATYTGPADNRFILVGSQGAILIATSSPALATTNDPWLGTNIGSSTLFAATVATNGPLLGTFLAAGTNGTIIIGGTPPAAPFSLGNQTNCASFPETPFNPPLVVTVTNEVDHPPGSVTVDWFDAHMTPLTNAALYAIFTNNAAGDFTNLTQDAQAFDANTPSNYVYYARARDLRTGFVSTNTTVILTINPRPMARLLAFNTTICDIGLSYTLTNTLTGIGPWTVTWNDGTRQTNNLSGPGPVILTRTVYPTNTFMSNVASNNIYFLTNVVDVDNCYANQAGDIQGAVTNTVNPRPTSVLWSFSTTNCDIGTTLWLTNVLTGIGPWTNTWFVSGLISNQVVGAAGQPGPYTNSYLVYPTNTFMANTASNNVFYVLSIYNGDSCSGNEFGDITGVVTDLVNPRPTSVLWSFTTTTCDIGTPLWLTNVLTGIGPWTNTWYVSGLISNQVVGAAGQPGPYTNSYLVYPTNTFMANTASNNVYSVLSVYNPDTCSGNEFGDITGTVTDTVNPRPTSALWSFSTTNCDIGSPLWLTNVLTGIGPWTNTWYVSGLTSNQVVGAAGQPGPYTNSYVVYPTNTFMANAPSNNVYYLLSVFNGDTCSGNELGDLTGTVTDTVNPRPTSVLWAFSTTNCDIGTSLWLTNVLTGIGPWTNSWYVSGLTSNQVVGAAGQPGPYTNSYLVYPTNAFMANAPSNNAYYLLSVYNADTCSGNELGDLTGTVTDTVNPRPTSVLWSFNSTNCDNGSPLWLTNVLTGIGPWTNTWYVSGLTSNQVVGAVGQPGPFTNSFVVYPTNTFMANTPSNNVYYLLSIYNGDTCSGNEWGDVTGIVTNTINPRPTSVLWSFATTTCDIGTPIWLTNVLTGIGPWTNTWYVSGLISNQVVGAAGQSGPYTNSYVVYPVNTFGASVPSNNVYYLLSVNNPDTCSGNEPGDLAGSVTDTVNPRPTASLLSFTSVDCNDNPVYTLTNTLTGLGPWVLYWNDGFVQTNNLITNGPVYFTRTVYPANTYGNLVPITNALYVLIVSNADTCAGNLPGDISGFVTNIVYPTPLSPSVPPVLPGGLVVAGTDGAGDIFETNVLGQSQTLAIFDQASYLPSWYDATLTNLLASDTFTYTPAYLVSGLYTNYVQVTDPGLGCKSGFTAVIEVLVPPAPASLGNQTNNALVPNLTLSVSPYVDVNNPAGRIISDWYNAPTGGTLLAAGTNSYTPITSLTATYWVGARDSVTGLVSPNRTPVTLVIVTNPPCVVTVSDNSTQFTLDFNDLPYSTAGENVPSSYAGLTWSNFGEVNGPNNTLNPSGYEAGAVPPGTNVLANDGGTAASISSAAPFDLLSGYFTAAWNDGLNLEVQGFNGAVQIYDTNFALSATVPTNLFLNYSNLTKVTFISSGGIHHAGYTGSGTHFALSDLVLATNLVLNTNVTGCLEPDAPAPVTTGYETNCAGLFNPALIVEVVPGATVNWYADATGTNLLARGVSTNSFTPAVTAPGAYTYYAQTVDTNNFASTNLTPVTLVLQSCTNPPESLVFGQPATNVITWYGNLLLESTTNLIPPIYWITNSTGLPGQTNYWTNSTVAVPIQFYRLYAPTN